MVQMQVESTEIGLGIIKAKNRKMNGPIEDRARQNILSKTEANATRVS